MNRMKCWNFSMIAMLAMLFSLPIAAQDMPKKTAALDEALAAQNIQRGEEVDYVPGFTLKGWTYVDPRHMTVMGEESRRYLVLLQKCYGLNFPTSSLIPKTSKWGRLAKYDKFLVKNKGMTIAHCDVRAVFATEPLTS